MLIIGARPYGLSISAHLRGLAVDHRIVGRPMSTWRDHMPAGMYLKSEPYGSDMSSPQAGDDLPPTAGRAASTAWTAGFRCRSNGSSTMPTGTPSSGARRSDVTVTEIKTVGGGFRVAFADADPVTVRQVVVATGVLPHAYVPPELSDLPAELLSHTADHHRLERFQGRRVAVVGSGQSALETAALLHEAGSDVQLVVRCPDSPVWHPRPLPLTPLMRARLPITKLCEGWKCVLWNTPGAFRRLPQDVRLDKARTVLGPRGAWWLRDRVEGKIEVLSGHRVRGSEPAGSGVRLLLDGPAQSSIDVDHIIAGTGFRMDVARLPFLAEGLRTRIATLNGYPVLTRASESTVPGLYFTGALAAYGIGPSMRFIAGTHNVAQQLARSVARRSRVNGGQSLAPEASDQMLQPK